MTSICVRGGLNDRIREEISASKYLIVICSREAAGSPKWLDQEIDFFLENGTNRVVFNEVNTLPGFTSISMYPMLWKEAGLPLPLLLDKLIEAAFSR